MLLGNLSENLLDFLLTTAWTEAFFHSVNNIVLFLEGFQTPLLIICGLMEQLVSLAPVTQASSQAFPDGLLFGPVSKENFWAMWFILETRHFTLFSQHAVGLINFMIGGLLTLLLKVWQDTGINLLLAGNPRDCIIAKVNWKSLRGRMYF